MFSDSRPDGAPPASHQTWQAGRLAWLIALIPVIPPLYLAAFGALGQLRALPRPIQYVLAFFAGTQLLAALFTPSPLLSLALAAARTLFVLAMIAGGMYLRDSAALRPLVWGYVAVFLTAWVFTISTVGLAGLQSRLGHPYYYYVSLGLIAAVCLWIVVSWKGASPWWRFPVGALALVTLLASGSRGPLLAYAVGALAAVIAGNRRQLRSLALLAVIAVAALGLIPSVRTFEPVQRLLTLGLSGRDQVWEGAVRAFEKSPVGGEGPYQIGPYLSFLYTDRCQLTPTLEQAGIHCPAWLARFRGAWLIAHNVVLHSLAETGVLGTLGLLAVMALGGVAVWRTQDGLLLAVFWGFTAMNLVDVVTAVPSPHFAELFWAVLGIAFRSWGTAPPPGPGPP